MPNSGLVKVTAVKLATIESNGFDSIRMYECIRLYVEVELPV